MVLMLKQIDHHLIQLTLQKIIIPCKMFLPMKLCLPSPSLVIQIQSCTVRFINGSEIIHRSCLFKRELEAFRLNTNLHGPNAQDMKLATIWCGDTISLSLRALPLGKIVYLIAYQVPCSVRNDAGHSLKSSISQEYNLDTRNDHIFPSNGLYLKIFQELAGIGGDVSFFKFELQTSKSLALPLGSSLTFSSRGGILKPIPFAPGFRNSSMINDRFQLGGPTSLRGFAPCGVGLKEKGNNMKPIANR